MKRVLNLLCAVIAVAVVQGQAPQEKDPEKVAPQVVLNIRKHPVGADLVQVTAASATYPQELLKKQCEQLGTYLNCPPRGLTTYVSGTDPKFRFVKAEFAVDGLIDRDKGTIDLQSVVRAFLGAPPPYTIQSFLVTLEGEAPIDKQTLRDYSSQSVKLKANVSTVPKGIEYRILVLDQVPTNVSIPGRYVPEIAAPQTQVAQRKKGSNLLPLAFLIIAGVSALALVYFAVSGRRGSTHAR